MLLSGKDPKSNQSNLMAIRIQISSIRESMSTRDSKIDDNTQRTFSFARWQNLQNFSR